MKTMKVFVRRRVFGILALALVLFLVYAAFWEGTIPAHAAATAYYVDCSQSTNGSGTESSPWNSLTAVNNHGAFSPGDSILFKQGTSCSGMLTPQGSGTASAPITLDSYTTGAPTSRPVINGGTNVAAIELSNQQYWNIQDLEVEGGNYRVILITANTANTTYSGFNLTNLVVHDTTQFTYGTWYTDAGGIILDPCNTTTFLSNIDINNVNVYHTFAQGIQVGHDNDAPQLTNCPAVNYANSVQNVTIENSVSDDQGATGAAIYFSKNVTIKNNVFYNNGFHGVHGEGSWSYDCNGCVWEYNESYDNHLGDGGGFDMDGQTTNSIVQYNYMHDNNGYCVSVFAVGGTANIDNANNTIRDNVCAHNDTEISTNVSDSGDIFISTFVKNSVGNQIDGLAIYNNTIYSDQNSTKLPSLSLQTTAGVSMFTGSNPDYFDNNIIYSLNPFMIGTDNKGMSLDYNLYWDTTGSPTFGYGAGNTNVNYPNFASYQSGSGQDAHSHVANPLLNNPTYEAIGISASAYTLQTGSPALGAGTLIANNGGSDFFGNSVSSSTAPNLGAYNGAATTGAGAITGTHVITNKYNGLNLDDYAFEKTNGAAVDQWQATGGTNQQWTLTAVGNDYEIINVYSGLALEDFSLGTVNGSSVDQWTYNGGANQLWTVTPVSPGYYRIVNVYSGLALDDYAYGKTNGTPVDQWDYHSSNNQLWQLS